MTNRSSSRVVFFFACFLCVGSGSGFSVHRSRDGVGLLSHSTRAPSTRSWCFTTLQSTDRGENKAKTRAIGVVNIHTRNADLIHSDRRRIRLLANQSDNTDDEMEIIMGLGDDTISDKAWEDIEAGAPSETTIMKELLGINIFTYILGAACIFFLSMNAILGPGWLGQVAGIQGTGSFTDVSDSLPGNVDLNNPENLLF